MEALILPSINNFTFNEEDRELTGKSCYSPMTTFSNDFSVLIQTATSANQNESIATTGPVIQELSHATESENETPVNVNKMEEREEIKPVHVELTVNIVTVGDIEKTVENAGSCAKEQKNSEDISCVVVKGRKCDISEEKQKYYVKTKVKTKNKKKSKHYNNLITDDDFTHEKKKKKWQSVKTDDFDFIKVSLFPRPISESFETDDDALKRFYEVEEELESEENMLVPFKKHVELEGKLYSEQRYLRPDRDRKKTKAHKQVKDKYCISVKNNKGRKKLFINHRLYTIISLELRTTSYLPSPTLRQLEFKRNRMREKVTANCRTQYRGPTSKPASRYGRGAPAQSLAHALDNHNAPTDIEANLLSLLISLQHRDVTPEDYDMLLRLDEQVAPKTLSENVINTFKTDIVDASSAGEVCAVCMDAYEVGQERKFLPCEHVFHSNCIEMWLKNSSMNCPIDNLSVENH